MLAETAPFLDAKISPPDRSSPAVRDRRPRFVASSAAGQARPRRRLRTTGRRAGGAGASGPCRSIGIGSRWSLVGGWSGLPCSRGAWRQRMQVDELTFSRASDYDLVDYPPTRRTATRL